ncbi:MAG TPA: FtsX-like permease family protein, partial [Vicinamibacteria bacterium]
AVWLPLAQVESRTAMVVARTRLSPPEALKMLERTVDGIAPDLLLFDEKSLESYLDLPTAPLRLTTASLGAMGALAALLSAIGLHALVAYTASRRTREMGIRIALGAEGRDVLSALLRRTALLVGASAAIGLALSLLVSRLLARFMFADFAPALPLAAAFLVMVTAVLACWTPARRALRIEPLEALRYE